MFGLFKSKNVLDEGSTQWILDTYAWALSHLNGEQFLQQTQLVLPNNQFFPDQADSPDEKAQLILQRIQGYCGMSQWPCTVQSVALQVEATAPPQVRIEGPLRSPDTTVACENDETILIPYDPNALRQPDILIASMAQNLAALLCRAIPTPPPGGPEYLPAAIDLTAIFLGFGLFMTNNAFNIQRGCSSCSGPSVQMMGELTEEQMCYALALFCHLKGIEKRQVLPYLKKTLHQVFKQSLKEFGQKAHELTQLTHLP